MAATDPQLSQSLVLRVVLLQESLGGAPEKQKRSEAHRVTSWGAGSAGRARAHLDGCTGSGTGPGRLWYMRMMFPISLLGLLCTLSSPQAGAGLGPSPAPASWAGSASASLAALAPPSVSGFFTTGGAGGDGAGTDREERTHVRP